MDPEIVACLLLALVPSTLGLVETQQKSGAKQPQAQRPAVAQPKKQPPKAVELKVTVVGRVEIFQEDPVAGVDYTLGGKVGEMQLATIGTCGSMEVFGFPHGKVSRTYVTVTNATGQDGKEIPGLSGQRLRIACDKLDRVGGLTGKQVQIQGVIREGKKMKGREIDVTSAAEQAAVSGQPPESSAPAAAGPPAEPPGAMRVRDTVQQAKLVRQVAPVYPPQAKQARIQGTVRFAAIIGKDGAVQSLQLLSGHPLLVPAAQDAVKQWVYEPTLVDGKPVEVITQIDVNFKLTE